MFQAELLPPTQGLGMVAPISTLLTAATEVTEDVGCGYTVTKRVKLSQENKYPWCSRSCFNWVTNDTTYIHVHVLYTYSVHFMCKHGK